LNNIYGLSRNIPSQTKQEIRRNSGFGCVFCGLFIYQYEHIDPEFKNAKNHDPKSICLVCPNCHSKITKGLIDKAQVKEAYNNPISKKRGYVNENNFTILRRPLTVCIGNIIFNNPRLLLIVDEKNLIEIKGISDGNLLLNAVFYDEKGKIILEIIDNEWITSIKNWDIEVKGKEIIIKNNSFDTILHVTVMPPNAILFNHIKMFLPDGSILESEFDKEKRCGFVKLITIRNVGLQTNKLSTAGYIKISKGNFLITGPTTFSGGQIGRLF